MQLVNAYLAEVGRYLPPEQRSDIVGELRDDILEQLAALAEPEGRVPELADERQVLTALGHPLKVASAYKPQRYLVGPGLYPAYLKTLKTSLCLVLALVVLLWLALGLDGSGAYSLKGLVNQLLNLAFWVVVAVTAAFMVFEASGEKLGWYHRWTPDRLRTDTSAVDLADLMVNLFVEGVFLLLWNAVLVMDLGLDARWLAAVNASPAVDLIFWPLNFVVAGFFLLHVIVLGLGVWQRWSAFGELVLSVALLGLLGSLLLSGPLVIGSAEMDSARLSWMDRSLRIALVVVVLFILWDAKSAYRRFARAA